VKKKTSLEKELISYTKKHQIKSKTAVINELYEVITTSINEGVSLDNIVSFLKTKNITVSRDYLKTVLYRIREKRKANHE
jgi:Ca2+-binding EF-hand superfamily protein